MKTMNKKRGRFEPSTMAHQRLACESPYDRPVASKPKNPVVRAGMSIVETVLWLVIMAALSIGMIVMLWNASR